MAIVKRKVHRGFKLPDDMSRTIDELAKDSGGFWNASDIVRLALYPGLEHVKRNMLPAIKKAMRQGAKSKT